MKTDHYYPLSGKTIVITRSQNQQIEARNAFEAIGAEIFELPALVIGPPDDWRPLDDALSDLNNFHWIIFSSINGVEAVNARLILAGTSLAAKPRGLKIAAVGKKTAQCLEQLGVSVDFIPPKFVAESLIENFPISGMGLRILFPRVQSGGREVLTNAFSQSGSTVVQVPAYESRCPDEIPSDTLNAFMNKEVNLIAFTSSKIVLHTAQLLCKYFGDEWQENFSQVKFISIGPQTSKSCKNYFGRVDNEADPHDLQGLIDACIKSTLD